MHIKVAEQYFQQVEDQLTEKGHIPINPLKINPNHPLPEWYDYMAEDTRALLQCDAIIMLENWTDSKGARIEHAIAKEHGLEMYYMQNHKLF